MHSIKFTIRSSTGYASETFKLISAQCIKSFMSGGMLNKSCFITKPIIAILPHTVEVRLMLPIVATAETAILVEPKRKSAFRFVKNAKIRDFYESYCQTGHTAFFKLYLQETSLFQKYFVF